LICLEDKLCPSRTGGSSLRDAVCVVLLVALAGVLLDAWDPEGLALLLGLAGNGGDAEAAQLARQRYLLDLAAVVGSVYLLPALGQLLALRCGAVDLSVWVSFGLGAAVPAALIAAGVGVGLSVAAGIAVGLAIGLLNGLLVVKARLPSVVMTIVLAVGAMFAAQAVLGRREIRTPAGAFAGWHLTQEAVEDTEPDADGTSLLAEHETVWLPLVVTRILWVLGIFTGALGVLVLASALRPLGVGRLTWGGQRWAALCASGALAAAGGVGWLIEHGAGPVPTRPVGDLRVAAAVILAGGLYLVGPGRSTLSGFLLVGGMVAATCWRQQAGAWHALGYDWLVAMLGGMFLLIYPVTYRGLAGGPGGRGLYACAAICAVLSAVLLAGAVRTEPLADGLRAVRLDTSPPLLRRVLLVGAAGVWTVSAVLAALEHRRRRVSGS